MLDIGQISNRDGFYDRLIYVHKDWFSVENKKKRNEIGRIENLYYEQPDENESLKMLESQYVSWQWDEKIMFCRTFETFILHAGKFKFILNWN